jgi:hypothetical protein
MPLTGRFAPLQLPGQTREGAAGQGVDRAKAAKLVLTQSLMMELR